MLVNACERNQLIYQGSSLWNAILLDFSHLSSIEKNAINDPGVIQLIYHFNKLYGNGIKSTKEPMIYFLEGQ